MFIDYHTHHERCGHASGKLQEYVEQAIKLGLDQLGLSDHMPIIHLSGGKILSGVAMEINQLEEYVKEATDLKKEYRNDIDIKVGLEADYIRGFESEIEKLLSPYPFDYIIGSVHFLGEWDFSDSRQIEGWKLKPIDEIFIEYYSVLKDAASSGLYDIVGHFDVIKKFGHIPKKDISFIIAEALKEIKRHDMVLEVNTSGLFKIVKEIYPSPQIIKQAVDMGLSLTLGSDAHKPEQVHMGLEQGRRILEQMGVRQIATFEQRRKKLVSLT